MSIIRNRSKRKFSKTCRILLSLSFNSLNVRISCAHLGRKNKTISNVCTCVCVNITYHFWCTVLEYLTRETLCTNVQYSRYIKTSLFPSLTMQVLRQFHRFCFYPHSLVIFSISSNSGSNTIISNKQHFQATITKRPLTQQLAYSKSLVTKIKVNWEGFVSQN